MKSLALLIEDDPQQSETIKEVVESRYRNLEVKWIETESDFYNYLESLTEDEKLPSVVICDVMLPWAFPAPGSPHQPMEVTKGTFRKAGLRCWKKFRQQEAASSIPWIHFTVLDKKTIDFNNNSDSKTGYAEKAGSIQPLIAEMERFKNAKW